MKRFTHQLLVFFMVVVPFASCSKKDPAPSSPPAGNLRFDRYQVKSYKMYVGSAKGGIDITDRFKDPSVLFPTYYDPTKSRFELEKYQTLRVTPDSIQELPSRYEANRFVYRVSTHDSLFRWNIYSSEWQFYGYKRADGSIEYVRSFYKFSKASGPVSLYLNGVETGVLSERDFLNANSYRFQQLGDMTSPTDTILFCNLTYFYNP